MYPRSASEGRGREGGLARTALLWLVFTSGVAVMGLEMSASRLIAPYFGSTLSVWTSLIGLVMIFLTTGYYLGGALADRFASRVVLGFVVMTAGALTVIVPIASKPVLEAAWGLTPKAGLLAASLVGTFSLFALPMVLLGCVCPFAMKLSLADLTRTGRTSGHIYAISALGSVVGTFLPALFMIDRWGVRHSIMAFGALLITAGLLLIQRLRFLPAAALLLLFLVPLPPMISAKGIIEQKESPYNFLQVVGIGDARILVVDWGAFSVYQPGEFRTYQYYDFLLLAPLLRAEAPSHWLKNVAIIGLGSGTAAKQITQAYGPVAIDGVEIDPAIVALGRRHFAMNERNLQVYVNDGRAFLANSNRIYDWVVVDTYQGSDIPFHLITKEFFQQVRQRLTPEGVLSVNIAWWSAEDQELLRKVVATVREVFPSVYVVTDISDRSGAVLLAGGKSFSSDHLLKNARTAEHRELLAIAEESLRGASPELSLMTSDEKPLTDDLAPVAKIADRLYRRERQAKYEAERRVVAGN